MREDKEALQALADNGQSPLKREQGQKLANKIRAVKYLECSALTQRGLKQVGLLRILVRFNPCYRHRGHFTNGLSQSYGKIKIFENSLVYAGSIYALYLLYLQFYK